MNLIFFLIVAIAFATAAFRQLTWDGAGDSPMNALSTAAVESATSAVELALGLVGVMALFLGLMKVAEAGGLLSVLARLIRPLLSRLFPEVPPDHPAMGAMVLNISANALGLGNAATPFGVRAMQELDKLNPYRGSASNSMVLFLAINTSSVTLLPTGVIAIRAAAGSADPAAIVPATLFATLCSTVAGVSAAFLYRRFFPHRPVEGMVPSAEDEGADREALPNPGTDFPLWISWAFIFGLLALIPLTVLYGSVIAPWIIPVLIVGFLTYGVVRRVPVYETFVEGAKDGFQVALRIIPYLVAILAAVGMFRASGALEAMVQWLAPWTVPLGMPPEALPMALLRPLSGSGAYGVMAGIINDPAVGPDSYTGLLVSTLQGSTETTFYVLAVYFGAVQIRRSRHALAAGLTADAAGIAGAIVACLFLFA